MYSSAIFAVFVRSKNSHHISMPIQASKLVIANAPATLKIFMSIASRFTLSTLLFKLS